MHCPGRDSSLLLFRTNTRSAQSNVAMRSGQDFKAETQECVIFERSQDTELNGFASYCITYASYCHAPVLVLVRRNLPTSSQTSDPPHPSRSTKKGNSLKLDGWPPTMRLSNALGEIFLTVVDLAFKPLPAAHPRNKANKRRPKENAAFVISPIQIVKIEIVRG